MVAFGATRGQCIACLFLLVAQPLAATPVRTRQPAGQALAKARPVDRVTLQATDMKTHRPNAGVAASLGNVVMMAASKTATNVRGDGEHVRKNSRVAGDAPVPKVADEVQKHVSKKVTAAAIKKDGAMNAKVAKKLFATRDSKKMTPSSVAGAIANVKSEAAKVNLVVQSLSTSNAEKTTPGVMATTVENSGIENEQAHTRNSIASALAAHSEEGQDDFIQGLRETQQVPESQPEKVAVLEDHIPDSAMSALDAQLASS